MRVLDPSPSPFHRSEIQKPRLQRVTAFQLMEGIQFDDNFENIDMWEWQGDDYTLQCDTGFEITQPLWDGELNDGNVLNMLEGQTPIKDCTDFTFDFLDMRENTNTGLEESRDASQMKWRRSLQFTSDVDNTTANIEETTFDFANSKAGLDSSMGDVMENLNWHCELDSGSFGDRYGFTNHGLDLDQSSDQWVENSFGESNTHCSSDEVNDYVNVESRMDVSEFVAPIEMETDVIKETPTPCCKNIKGKKSYITTPLKLTASVAYPFTLIKPCGVQGDLTLKDINQRIHAPLSAAPAHKNAEESSVNYPTSAFTGKLVVVKTKIHTEGGKGSITIMRTRG